MKLQRAFTLVEILIVMAILSVVITVPVLSFASVNQKARDQRRKEDVDKLSAALQAYRNDNGTYPDVADYASLSTFLEPKYSTNLPIDPRNATPYTYVYQSINGGQSFNLYATLEKQEGGNNLVYANTPAGSLNITGTPPAPTTYTSPGYTPLSATPSITPTPSPSATPTPDGSFLRTFGTGSSEIANSMAIGTDNGYAVAGSSNGSGYIAKFTSSGSKVWEKKYNSGGETGAIKQITTATGGYGVLGTLNNNAYVSKIADSGTITWTQQLVSTPTTAQSWYAIREISGDILVAGNFLNGSDRDLTIIRYNNVGSVLAKKIISVAGTHTFEPRDIQINGNDIAIVGRYNNGTNDFGFFASIPVDLVDGSVTIKTYRGTNQNVLYSLAPKQGGGGFVAAGYTNSYSADYDGWLLDIGTDGTVNSGGSSVYHAGNNDFFYSIKTVPGGYALAGSTLSYTPRGSTVYGQDGIVLRIESDLSFGANSWVRTLGYTNTDYLNSIQLQGGSLSYFLVAGQYQPSSGQNDFMLAKIRSTGSMYSCSTYLYESASPPVKQAVSTTTASLTGTMTNYTQVTSQSSTYAPSTGTVSTVTNVCH